jgi:hypothetical protein
VTTDIELFRVIGKPIICEVPQGYVHETFLEDFRKRNASVKKFHMVNEVSSENYPHASTKLVPGMRLEVTEIGIHDFSKIRISACVKYLINEGASLTNVHGLGLMYEQSPGFFEKGRSYTSLDVKEMLWLDPDDKEHRYRHPYIHLPKEGEIRFSHALNHSYGALMRLLMFKILST